MARKPGEPNEIAKMQKAMAAMQQEIDDLRSANALQYSIDSGVGQLTAVAQTLNSLLPSQGTISRSLELIAGKLPEAPNLPEPNSKKADLLKAIAASHPMFDLDGELEAVGAEPSVTADSELNGDTK
ncbi:MAG: hypothetical protein AAFY51_01605 [Pseudomonadota bacterium]